MARSFYSLVTRVDTTGYIHLLSAGVFVFFVKPQCTYSMVHIPRYAACKVRVHILCKSHSAGQVGHFSDILKVGTALSEGARVCPEAPQQGPGQNLIQLFMQERDLSRTFRLLL